MTCRNVPQGARLVGVRAGTSWRNDAAEEIRTRGADCLQSTGDFDTAFSLTLEKLGYVG